jgi:DNA-binding winged helix-turn-helix (wHTH) protein
MEDGGRLRFGPFELDLRAGELRREGRRIHLREQSVRLLAALASRPGDVVTREELRAHLWPTGTFVDFDQGLNHCVREVRAALGDAAAAPCFVATLPRRGYRFVAPVERVAPASEVLPPAPARPKSRARAAAATGALAVTSALAVLGAFAAGPWRAARSPEPSEWSRLTFRRGTVTGARFAPGGGLVVSAAFDGEAPALYVHEPGDTLGRRLGAAAQVETVTRAGDVSALVERGGPLVAFPLAGGTSRGLVDGVTASDATTDGTSWAAVRPVPGRGPRLYFPLDRELCGVRPTRHLRIAPDGRHLALVQHPEPGDDAGFVVVLDRDGRRVARTRDFSSVEGLAWAPHSREVWFTASTSGSDTAVRALDLRGSESVVIPSAGRLVLRDVDAQGRLLLERTSVRAEVRHWSGSGERDLSWQDGTVGVALTTAGEAALLHEMGEAAGPAQAVLLRPTSGSPPTRLGTGRPSALSPDGRLAAVVPALDRRRIDLLPTRPGPPGRLTFDGIAEYHWLRWVDEGRRVVFLAREPGRPPRVFVGSPDGGRARPVTPEGRVTRPELVAPDGGLLSTCGEHGVPCVYRLDAEPLTVRGLEGRQALAVHPSGDLRVQARGARFPMKVERLEPARGARTAFAVLAPPDRVGAGGVSRLVVSGDGKSFAYTFSRRLSELYLVPRVR